MGEKRERKSGPLKLDWKALLSTGCDDREPPPELVIEAAGKSNLREDAMMDDGVDDSASEQIIRQVSDKELMDKISRWRKCLVPMSSRLPDGGEKFLANLKKHEAELERRNILKDDNKCKKATPLGNHSSCTGAANDLLPGGAPLSVSSQSTFAVHFCSKLDARRENKAFKEELSALSRFDHKKIRGHGQTQETHKIGLSSRQAPFRSPSHLSQDIDKPPQATGEQSGSHSPTPSPHNSAKDVAGYFAQMGRAPQRGTISNPRWIDEKTVVLVDDEELEVDVIDQAERLDQCTKKMKLFYPSRDDPEAIDICFSDMECLAPESFLSSPIMNFYIRYLQKSLSPIRKGGCHFFNTYFYEKLKGYMQCKIGKETEYVRFRKWWKGVNLFEKAYIFLPIHEDAHWSLVIICIPNKEDKSGPIMLHLDSLGLHSSKSIFIHIKSFLIEEWKFLRQEEVLSELPIADEIWGKLSRRIDEKVIEVPQQTNAYDCGLFVLFFMERFIEEAPERMQTRNLKRFSKQWFRPEEASSLRQKIRHLLREEFDKANENTCKSIP